MCLLDGQMTGSIPNNADVCGPGRFSITDTRARYPVVARQCGWNILVTVEPQCPPNDCRDAATD